MPRVYKTVRIAYETKKWLNDIIQNYEKQLKTEREILITKYEDKLRKLPEFTNYSPALSISVSSGSIVEAAYHFCSRLNLSRTDWAKISEQAKKVAKAEAREGQLDVGSITPRLFIDSEVLEGLENMQWELKPDTMQRNLQFNYILKLVIFRYYLHMIKGI